MEDKQLSIKLRVHQIHAALCVWYPSRKIKQRTDQAFTDSQLSLFFFTEILECNLAMDPTQHGVYLVYPKWCIHRRTEHLFVFLFPLN